MTISVTLDDLEASTDAARPYMMHEDTRLPAMRLPIRTIAAGAINTSVADLANWMRLHLGKGEFKGERLAPAALIDALHAPRVHYTEPRSAEFGEAHYGLGFRCQSYRGDRLVFHGGGWPGWGTQMTLVPDLGITFLTDREGNIVSLSAPLEPMVKDIVFVRLAAGDCTDAAFRARCVGIFKSGPTTHSVTLDAEGRLVLKPDNQPAYRLAPQHGRRFRIVELEGFVVEFRREGTIIDEMIFHQPNGTFVARRLEHSG